MEQGAGVSAARNARLSSLELVGEGMSAVAQIGGMIGHARFFDDFTDDDVRRLATFMRVYRAPPNGTLIAEGEVDDYLLLIIDGHVDVRKRDKRGVVRTVTSVGPGMTLGAMSMVDGEPRFATCVATEPTTFAILSREGMGRILHEAPGLGAKVLIRLVTLLSQRLRQTSATLLHYMER